MQCSSTDGHITYAGVSLLLLPIMKTSWAINVLNSKSKTNFFYILPFLFVRTLHFIIKLYIKMARKAETNSN